MHRCCLYKSQSNFLSKHFQSMLWLQFCTNQYSLYLPYFWYKNSPCFILPQISDHSKWSIHFSSECLVRTSADGSLVEWGVVVGRGGLWEEPWWNWVALMLVMWLSDTSRWCITEPCPEIVVHLEGERDCTAIPGAKLGPMCLRPTCLSLHCGLSVCWVIVLLVELKEGEGDWARSF